MGIMTRRARSVAGRRGLVLDAMTLAAGGLLCAAVRLVARRAGCMFHGRVLLSVMAARALGAARLRVVGQASMTLRAVAVSRVGVGASMLVAMAVGAERRVFDALHESVRLVALGAREVFLPMTVILAWCGVAAPTGQRLGTPGARGMRLVTGHASAEGPLL